MTYGTSGAPFNLAEEMRRVSARTRITAATAPKLEGGKVMDYDVHAFSVRQLTTRLALSFEVVDPPPEAHVLPTNHTRARVLPGFALQRNVQMMMRGHHGATFYSVFTSILSLKNGLEMAFAENQRGTEAEDLALTLYEELLVASQNLHVNGGSEAEARYDETRRMLVEALRKVNKRVARKGAAFVKAASFHDKLKRPNAMKVRRQLDAALRRSEEARGLLEITRKEILEDLSAVDDEIRRSLKFTRWIAARLLSDLVMSPYLNPSVTADAAATKRRRRVADTEITTMIKLLGTIQAQPFLNIAKLAIALLERAQLTLTSAVTTTDRAERTVAITEARAIFEKTAMTLRRASTLYDLNEIYRKVAMMADARFAEDYTHAHRRSVEAGLSLIARAARADNSNDPFATFPRVAAQHLQTAGDRLLQKDRVHLARDAVRSAMQEIEVSDSAHA